jgi:hypothetical protein
VTRLLLLQYICVDGNECVNRAHQASNQQAQIQAFSLKTVEVTW